MKKKINIFLVIVVLLLWGSVIYKSLNNYFFTDKSISVTSDNYTVKEFKIREKDTFSLDIINRDPFLNKSFFIKKKSKGIHITTKKTIKKDIIPVKKIKTSFPSISYYGYIKSKEKKDELIIIKVHNQIKKLRLSESFEGLTIKKIFKDSIQISNGFETKTFRKS